MKVTSQKVTSQLINHLQGKGAKIILKNSYMFSWESDVYCVDDSDKIEEFEVKVSRSDFNADFTKVVKHDNLEIGKGKIPNKFWYVVPKGLIEEMEVPEYAGLIYFMGDNWFKTIKQAPVLHDRLISVNAWEKIALKLYNRTL